MVEEEGEEEHIPARSITEPVSTAVTEHTGPGVHDLRLRSATHGQGGPQSVQLSEGGEGHFGHGLQQILVASPPPLAAPLLYHRLETQPQRRNES